MAQDLRDRMSAVVEEKYCLPRGAPHADYIAKATVISEVFAACGLSPYTTKERKNAKVLKAVLEKKGYESDTKRMGEPREPTAVYCMRRRNEPERAPEPPPALPPPNLLAFMDLPPDELNAARKRIPARTEGERTDDEPKRRKR